MKKKKNVLLVFVILFLILLLSIFKIYKCPLKYLLGLSCPTCGITRAIVSVLQLNFPKAFHYHLLWPITILGFIIFTLYELKIIKISKKTMYLIMYIVCFLNILYYFYRLLSGSDIVYFDFTESLFYKIINFIFKVIH